MKLWRVGLVRAFVGAGVGGAVGIGLIVLPRLLLRMEPTYEPAPATAVSIVTGVVGWLIGVGAFRDWWGWALGQPAGPPSPPPADEPRWLRYLSYDTNHKVIGIQYTLTMLTLMCLAGLMAMAIRLELAAPGMQFLTTDAYNTLVGNHGILMIAVILIGIAGLSNYFVPILLGAQDMAFPRLNAFSYWLVLPAGLLILLSLATGGFSTGWTGYPPLGARDPLGAQFFYLGVFVLGLSSILGSVNLITTIFKMRAPGMKMFRMPIFCWSVLAASFIQLVATQFIAMAFLMVVAQRLLGIGFFDPTKGGNALLYQNLFWFYSHPVVYVFVLPGFGIISELLPVFARKPLFGYRVVAISSMAIAFVGFLVWGHHMFATGMSTGGMIYFMFATLLVAVPTGVKIFSWLGTLWQGVLGTLNGRSRVTFPTPMLFVLGAILLFLLGGLTGPFLAVIPEDLYLTDTYWVVSHFHQVMFGGFLLTFFAAVYYWFPKMTGYRCSELLGKVNFWLMLAGMLVMNFFLYRVGLLGMLRRVADYEPSLGFGPSNLAATVGGFMIGFSVLIFLINMVWSLARKRPSPDNPWNSRSPEWQISSPPSEENFPVLPEVVGDPYEYGVPGAVYMRFGGAGTPGTGRQEFRGAEGRGENDAP
jgi:cytochrome c oxidase subunit 1